MSRKVLTILLLIALFSLSGCNFLGGAGSSSTTVVADDTGDDTGGDTPGDVAVTGSDTGVFIDAEVAGLSYVTSSGVTGVTDSQGRYNYNPGDTVTFTIGGITLGTCSASEYVTPRTIFANNNAAALRLAQFLQSVDSDGDPSNGITPNADDLAPLSNINFEDDDFETVLQANLPSHLTFVSAEDAMKHMDDTIAQLGIRPDGSAEDSYRVFAGADADHGIELWITRDGKTFNFFKDIDDGGSAGSYPIYKVAFGDKLIFRAKDAEHGYEPWISDGTASGTYMIKDINAGSDSSVTSTAFCSVGDKVFFKATTPDTGYELWVTDGTEAGTVMVKDIYAGLDSSDFFYMTAFDGEVYFTAISDSYGYELWMSDGTAAGTIMLKDILSGSSGSMPHGFTEMNGNLYFTASDGSNNDVWVTDGTEVGTIKIHDGTDYISDMATLGGNLFFEMSGNLFKYDGTNFTDLGIVGNVASGDYAAGDTLLYLRGGNYVFVTDGTSITKLLDANNDGLLYANNLVTIGDRLYFRSKTDSLDDFELYTSNGTTTQLVKNINDGDDSDPNYLTVVGSEVFFEADDGVHGDELWKTDGTSAGTVMVKDIDGESSTSTKGFYTTMGSELFFYADDEKHGSELWKSDGTEAGTVMVADVNTFPTSSLDTTTPFVKAGDSYFFTATTLGTSSFWTTDGTAAGTASLNLPPARELVMLDFDEKILLLTYDISTGYGLVITDGTTAGTEALAQSNTINNVAVSGDLVYFNYYDSGDDETYVYVSDGTSAGTRALLDSNGDNILSSSNFIPVGLDTYICADFGDMGNDDKRLYITDGTPDGTTLLKQVTDATEANSLNYFAAADDKLVFNMSTAANGNELWISDGTSAGTQLLKNIGDDSSGVTSSNPAYLKTVRDKVFFTVDADNTGSQLWKTDGTTAGTTNVFDTVSRGIASPYIAILATVDNKLYFTATSSERSARLVATSKDIMVTYSDMDIVQALDSIGTNLLSYPSAGFSSESDDYLLLWYKTIAGGYLKKILGSSVETVLEDTLFTTLAPE